MNYDKIISFLGDTVLFLFKLVPLVFFILALVSPLIIIIYELFGF